MSYAQKKLNEMIGNKIKSLIEQSPLTFSEVAEALNMTYVNLFRIFNKESVETKHLEAIAKIINVPITAFFNEASENDSLLSDLQEKEEEIATLWKQLETERKYNKFLEGQIDMYKGIVDDKILIIELQKAKTKTDIDKAKDEAFQRAEEKFKVDQQISKIAEKYWDEVESEFPTLYETWIKIDEYYPDENPAPPDIEEAAKNAWYKLSQTFKDRFNSDPVIKDFRAKKVKNQILKTWSNNQAIVW